MYIWSHIYIYNVYINVWIDLIWCDWIRSIIHSMNLWICISLSSSISIYNQYHISISIQCGKRATGSHLLKVLVADECCRSDLHGGLQLQQCQVTLQRQGWGGWGSWGGEELWETVRNYEGNSVLKCRWYFSIVNSWVLKLSKAVISLFSYFSIVLK